DEKAAEAIEAQTIAETETRNAREAEATAQAEAQNARLAQSEAEHQSTIARARQLAAQSTVELENGHYEPALLLAIEAAQITELLHYEPVLEAFHAIRNAIEFPGRSRAVLYGHKDWVYQATWSKDESRILTASSDGMAIIWDTDRGRELMRFKGHT